MYQKTVEREEGYSRRQVAAIKRALDGLRIFRKSPEAMAYIKKRKGELRAKTR